MRSFEEKHDINIAEDEREVEDCTCPPPLTLFQSPHVHNSVSEEALLLLDVVICMDLKKGWGGFHDTHD